MLKDNKGRDFKLVGIPDLVIEFEDKTYGIIDFKTTKISEKKADFYKFQLEAYATIFENPGEINSIKTPLLSPVTKLAILQFDPLKIEKDRLICEKNLNEDEDLNFINSIMNEIEEAFQFAEQDAFPDLETAENFVYEY